MNIGAFADVEFLASSPNRIQALDLLSNTTLQRPELESQLGISRMTAKRILDAFETRGWVKQETGYRTTPLGDVVKAEFECLLDTVETVRKLATIFHWLPDDFDVDPRQLADASVTLNTWSDSVAPVRRAAELAKQTDFLRVAGSGISPDVIKAIRDAAVAGSDVTFVTTDGGFEVLSVSDELSRWMVEAMDAGADLHTHPGFPYLIAQCDDFVIIGVNDESGAPRGLVESSNSEVREWVVSTIERCRSEGEVVYRHQLE
jgi:predicted transcriptional regulator